MPTLVSQVFNAKFEPYEFLDARAITAEQTESALTDAKTQVMEKLHQVAFRTGLGNTIFASNESLNSLKRTDIGNLLELFTADRITIVGTEVNHEDLTNLLEKVFVDVELPSGKASYIKSKFSTGEARIEAGPTCEAHYAIAFPGAAYSTSGDFAAAQVLASILGGERKVTHGSSSGLLAACAAPGCKATAHSLSYSDAGLLVLYMEGDGSSVKDVATKSIAILKNIAKNGVSPEILGAGKKAAQIDFESQASRNGRLQNFIKTPSVSETQNVISISSITAEQIKNVIFFIILASSSCRRFKAKCRSIRELTTASICGGTLRGFNG